MVQSTYIRRYSIATVTTVSVIIHTQMNANNAPDYKTFIFTAMAYPTKCSQTSDCDRDVCVVMYPSPIGDMWRQFVCGQ